VPDLISFPERIHELLERWCSGRWAGYLVATIKFQGAEIVWSDMYTAIVICKSHFYSARVVEYFFNNKNEVLMMAHDLVTGRTGVNGALFARKTIPGHDT
jgi:hypothetical protein